MSEPPREPYEQYRPQPSSDQPAQGAYGRPAYGYYPDQPPYGQRPRPRFIPAAPEQELPPASPRNGYAPARQGYQQPPPGYPPPGYYQQPPPPPPPRRKRHWVRNFFLACVAFVVGIIIVVVATSGGNNGSPSAASAPSATASSAAGAAAPAKAATVGTPVRDGKFQFTITSVSQAKSVGDTADDLGDTAQGEYTILHVTVTNIGSQPQTLDDSSQYVYDSSGRKYDASTDADLDLDSPDGADSTFLNDINPGNTVQGQIAFDMPTGVKAVKAELHDSVFSGGVTVSLP